MISEFSYSTVKIGLSSKQIFEDVSCSLTGEVMNDYLDLKKIYYKYKEMKRLTDIHRLPRGDCVINVINTHIWVEFTVVVPTVFCKYLKN